jgi:peptide/nickel transport system substrate-binding protein
MNETKRNWGRAGLYATVAASLVISLVPFGAGSAAAQGNTRKIGDFDVSGRFLEVWSKNGNDQANTYVNGLPITAVRNEISTEDGKTYSTQWFERARYEAHPENTAPYDVLLGRLGAKQVEGRGGVDPATKKVRNPADEAFVGIDKPADANGTTKAWFQETRHSVSGKLKEYWDKYGGLQQFGFPLSEAFDEISATDGKTYSVQYFERGRAEVHPEKAAPYEVEFGLLGVQQYKQTPVAADKLAFAPIAGQTTTKTTMVIGSSQEPDNLTIFNNALINSRIRTFIEGAGAMTQRDDEATPGPALAWYVPTLENGGAFYSGIGDDRHLVVKYKMRQGVKWADGKEVTSNDALYFFKLYMDELAPVTSRSELQKLENVDNPDKYTVIYNYRSLNQLNAYYNSIPNKDDYAFLKVYIDAKKPAGSLTYSEIGGYNGVYPQHVLQNIPADKIKDAPFATTPLGFGPWKVQSWNKKQDMTLVLNENYNLTAKPLITTIKIKYITDVNQLLAQVKTGELDMIFSEAFNAPPADKAGIEAAGYKVVSKPAVTWEHLDFYFLFEPFKDKAVRQAMSYAINRQRVSDVSYAGTAGVMNTVTPPLAPHSLENVNFAKNYPDLAAKYKLPIYNYDPAKANSMLDAAGWAKGADGIRAKGGQKLSFEYATTIQAIRQQNQALVQADLKAVGIDAVLNKYDASVFFAGDDTDPRANGTTKLAEFAYVGSPESGYESWTCDQRWNPETFAGANNQQYCNPELDKANADYNANVGKESVEASAKAQVILAEEAVVIPLVQRANIEVVRATLQNHKETNSQVTSNWNALQWAFK